MTLNSIHKLTSEVDRQATRVAQIGCELTSESELSDAAAETVVVQLLDANRQLQQDLAMAQEELLTQRRQLDSYRVEALTDALTGLPNRRRFDQELNGRIAQWRASGKPLSLVLIDVDHFKAVNDVHGHVAGDAILHELAQVLLDNVRANDLVARYGGEEFGIILPGATLDDARQIAERIRGAIDDHSFKLGDAETTLTVCAGVAQAIVKDNSELLTARADAALYAAKDDGRNCCQFHDGQSCTPVPKSFSPSRRTFDASRRIAPPIDG